MITDTQPPGDTEHAVYELELVGEPELCWYLYLDNCALAVTGGPLTSAQARIWADEQLAHCDRTGPVEWINTYDDAVDEDTATRFAARLTPIPIPAKLTPAGAAAAAAILGVIAALLALTPSTGAGIGAVGAVFAVLYGADWVADFWVQTQHQADTKNAPGWRGWSALLLHVVTYTATAALGLAALAWRTDLGLHPVNVLVGLAVYAVSHGWADRRNTLAWLAAATGSGRFYAVRDHGINGALLLDRSWHIAWSAVVALLLV